MGSLNLIKFKPSRMYKMDLQQHPLILSKQYLQKPRQKQSRQLQDNKSRQMKQNDSKHMNAIRPYVSKQRKSSTKREIKPTSSTTQINRSRSKRLQSTTSNRKSIQQQHSSIISCENINQKTANGIVNANSYGIVNKNSQPIAKQKQINQIYHQMVTLKSQYKSLKTSYNSLMKQKQHASSKQQMEKQLYQRQKLQLLQQLQKTKKSSGFLQSQIQRIKRQCFKIIQSEKFKYKKLQQTLQQKELMIAYLRKQIDALKRGLGSNKNNYNYNSKELLNSSVAQQENLEKIFFLQNSAPIFSYQSYARLSANTSAISNLPGNVLIEQHSSSNAQTQTLGPFRQAKQKIKHKKKGSQFEEDSLSFSRDNLKQFDSVHSLLSNYPDKTQHNLNNNDDDDNDHTILTFTKKDIVVLDDSLSLNDSTPKQSQYSQQQDQCPTFENRKQHQTKQIISFQSLRAKRQLSKSNSHRSQQRKPKSRQQTKRLQILTDHFKQEVEKKLQEDVNSCDTKKKLSSKDKSKSKTKNVKKASKSEGLHSSMMTEVFHSSFVKKDSHSNVSQGKAQMKKK